MRLEVFAPFLLIVRVSGYVTDGQIHEAEERNEESEDGEVWQNELEENEGMIEGDIIPNLNRNGIRDPYWRWDGGVVPYTVSRSFSSGDARKIRGAMTDLERKVKVGSNYCIHFVAWNPSAHGKDHLQIVKGTGCSSMIGRTHRGAQNVNLASGFLSTCMKQGIIQHELMHALGFYHEQSRYDRDDWITVNWGNIKKNHEHNFRKETRARIDHQGQPYDYGSLMHYGATSFGKFGLFGAAKTITTKKNGARIGQRNGPSPIDIKEIQLMYKCG